MEPAGGVVLAGGRSSRMGTAKADLEWHGSTLLRRVVGIVGRSGGPVVVVRAAGQALPSLPPGVEVVEDDRDGRGPLQGILAGLRALRGRADVAYISSTDVPLLHPAFVAMVVAAVGADHDIAVPHVGGHRHPLSAAYRTTTVLPAVEALVAAERMKPAFLFELVRTRWLDEHTLLADPRLAKVDPRLDSVSNLNEPADYEAARALPAPEVHVERFGTLRLANPSEVTVRAATLGAAVRAAGHALDPWLVAALNGDQVSRDEDLPLAAGDVVSLIAGDAGG